MKTVTPLPIRRHDQNRTVKDGGITVRISGLESTMFLVNKAAAVAGYKVNRAMGSRGSHYFSMTFLQGKSLRETALFMLDVAEIVRGTWWAIRDRPVVVETKLSLDVIERLETALVEYHRFEIRT